MVLRDELGGDEKIVVVPRMQRMVSNDSAGSFSNPSKSAHLNEMESKLVGFIEKLLKEISSSDATSLHKHKTLVFLPVGVPGMGKTTLGRFLESAS